MKEYVLDSSAILLYLRGTADASKVESLILDGEGRKAHLIMSAINWAECRHTLIRQRSAASAQDLLSQIAKGVEIVVADRFHAELAADLKCRFKVSLADCFAASLAIVRKAALVTSDPEFDALKREIKIVHLDSRRGQ